MILPLPKRRVELLCGIAAVWVVVPTCARSETVHAVTEISYDGLQRPVCTTVRMNPTQWNGATDACTPQAASPEGPDRISRNVYDPAGQVVQIRRAVGTGIEQAYATYTYSPTGKQTTVIDSNGNRATFAYDAFNRLERWSFPSSNLVSGFNPATPTSAEATAGPVNAADFEFYAYDDNGNRTSLRRRDGSTLNYQYDALNQMTAKIVPERAGLAPTHTRDVYYAYDLRGLQTLARFDSLAGEGIATTYDGRGRPIATASRMDGPKRTLQREFDLNGNITRITHPDGTYFTMTYDGLNRMVGAAPNGAAQFVAISYDDHGRRSNITRGASSTGYSYDAVSRLTGMSQQFASGTLGLTETFDYNPASQIVRQQRDNSAYSYTDHVDGSRSYTVNGLNQYSNVAGATLSYDASGNLTSDGATTYLYDVENRLVAASGANNAALRYDPLGRLYETNGGAAGITRFLYDGDALIAEYAGSGSILRRYMHGPGTDELILWDEGGAMNCTGTNFLHTNHQGSVIASANCVGAPTATNRYDQWGVRGAGNVGRFQYTGQAWISELAMYHYKARIYSPALGRFLQTDPIGYDDQQNLYAYVGNDPINFRDSSGQNVTVITNYDGGIGHTAVYVDAGNGRKVLYDPGGVFAFRNGGGSGDALFDSEADLMAYIRYHNRNGESIRLQTIETSLATDLQIIQNVSDQGGGAPLFCTSRVCDAVFGTKIDRNVEGSMIPSTYANNVADSDLTLRQDVMLNPDGSSVDNRAQRRRDADRAAQRRDYCIAHPGANC